MTEKKPYLLAVVLIAAFMLASGQAFAQGKVKLEIVANPSQPPAKVWIDHASMESTPLSMPYFAEGTHLIRVSRQGAALERKVTLKAGTEVILEANFIRNDISVKNQESLNYNPLTGKTMIVLTPAQYEPAPPEPPPEKPAEKPAEKEPEKPKAAEQPAPPPPKPAPADTQIVIEKVPEKPPEESSIAPGATALEEPVETIPEKPEPEIVEPEIPPEPAEPETIEPEPADTDTTELMEPEPETGLTPAPVPEETAVDTECPPDEWCPLPQAGEMGPPVPPDIRARIDQRKLLEKSWIDEQRKQRELELAAKEQARLAELEKEKEREPEIELVPETGTEPEKAAETEPEPPSPACNRRAGAAACRTYGAGIRGAIYAYYCYLVNNDFANAHESWGADKDVAEFYKETANFCGISDYRIRGFQVLRSTSSDAQTSYVVDFLNSRGAVIESWAVSTELIKKEGVWRMYKSSKKPFTE